MSSSFADFDKDMMLGERRTNPALAKPSSCHDDLMYEEVDSEIHRQTRQRRLGYIATGTSLYSDFPSVIDLYPNSTNGLFMNDMGSFPMEDASDAVNPFNTVADFNLDGALDLVSHQIGTHAHLMNGVPNGNHWVSIPRQGCNVLEGRFRCHIQWLHCPWTVLLSNGLGA